MKDFTYKIGMMADTRFHFSHLCMATQENFISNLFVAQVDSLKLIWYENLQDI